MQPHPVVLVPGIMGSELVFQGQCVWAADKRALRAIDRPSYLLPWLPLSPGQPVSTYVPLVSFLRRKGFRPNQDLFLFGYDWRRGVQTAAEELSRHVDSVVRMQHGGQIIFLAHSLGCLIVQWAITHDLVRAAKIKAVIAAGPPSLGSAKSFRSLLEIPSLSRWFGRMHALARLVRPTRTYQIETSLLKSLMTVRSVVELLPPRDLPILSVGTSQLFSAFEWSGWPDTLSNLLRMSEQTLSDLEARPWRASDPPRTLIASKVHPTETGYLLHATDPFRMIGALPTDAGDGTVLVDSALEFGFDGGTQIWVDSRHDELLNDPTAMQFLDTLL